MKRHHLVVSHMRVLLVIESEGLDDLAQTNLVSDGVLQRRIVMLNDGDDLLTVHLLHHLALFGLTEAGFEHLTKILMVHKILVQLLDADHLFVVEPIGRLQLLQLIDYLGIQLTIVDLARVINQQTVRNPDADVTTTAS